ncbi:efflux transporter outer membrane subunit [Andreprevotia chitinilytica]|uniref:efflux transporter outer membrane subunit n=1 Tax=Andreprevotia chitinilytica TaxID=396808 RepID=UPI000556BBB7|nr:efflux transporter outer membrane subunit [Andreprevotia chitinilytica]
MLKPMILAMAVALSGCAVIGPNYERPASPASGIIGRGDAATVAVPSWDVYFSDPTLNALIKRALDNNRDLRVAVANIEVARAQYGITNADRLPTLSVGGSATINHVPASLSSTGQSMTSRRYDANVALASFELDFWGRVARLSESAKASYLATEEAQRTAKLSLIAEVANSYYNLLALNEEADFARKTAKTREDYAKVIGRKVDIGSANRLDQLQAENSLDSALSDSASLSRQAETARTALGLLVGDNGPLPMASGKGVAALPLPQRLPQGLSSDVLLDRPDVRQAEQQLIAANANVGAARAAFFPKITLVGSAGVASDSLGDLFKGDRGAWSFLPSITLPIFDFGRTKSNLDLASARKNVAVAQYEKAVQQAFKDTADVLSDQRWLAEQLTVQERLAQHQEERLKLARARYDVGVIGYLDVLDAERDSYNAQQSLIETRRARLANSATAYKVLGGADQATTAQ